MTTRIADVQIRIILILFIAIVTTPIDKAHSAPQVAPLGTTLGSVDALIHSKDLFDDRRCVYIEHEGMIYALRTTRAGKLILTK